MDIAEYEYDKAYSRLDAALSAKEARGKQIANRYLGEYQNAKIKDLRGIRMYMIVEKINRLGKADKIEYMKSGFIIGKQHEANPWD